MNASNRSPASRAGRLFAVVYVAAVIVAAATLGPAIRRPVPLAIVLAVPALFAFAVSIPYVNRSTPRQLLLLFFVVGPLLATLTIGGLGVALAYIISGMSG